MAEKEQQTQTAVAKREDKFVEYVPFGSQDKIKLTIQIIQNLIAVPTKSGKTCSERDAIKFMAMCQAKHLNPFEGDAYLIGYDGQDGPTFSLITAHQTYLKRAETHPEFDGMKSGIIVEEDKEMKDLEGDFHLPNQKVLGGWATVFFKNRSHPMHKRIRLARFQKSFGVWREDPAGMICKCAEADALRSSFPTMLGGMYLKEEMEAQAAEMAKPVFEKPKASLFNRTVVDVTSPPATTTADDKGHAPEEPAEGFSESQEEMPLADTIRSLCAHDGIPEAKLVDSLFGLGICDSGSLTIDELVEQSPAVAEMVATQWAEICKRIKSSAKK